MPEDVKFSISLPDGRQTEWDQKQYNKGANTLFEKYPDAQVNRISGYSEQSDLTPDSSFHITLDDGRETDWNYDQFSKGRETLLKKYPNAKISVTDDITAQRNRDFAHQYEFAQSKVDDINMPDSEKQPYIDFVGQHAERYDKVKDKYGNQYNGRPDGSDRLVEIYSRMEALQKELEGLPQERDYRGLSREEAVLYAQEANSPEGRRRSEIKKELEQLRKERETNPAWQAYWNKTEEDLPGLIDAMDAKAKEYANVGGRSANMSDQEALDLIGGAEEKQGNEQERDYYLTARKYYKEALETAKAPSKYDDSWGIVNFAKGAGANIASAVSILELAKSLQDVNLINTVKQIQQAEGKDVNLIDLVNNESDKLNYLSDGQKEMLKAFAKRYEVEQGRSDNMSIGYNAGKGAITSLGFMGDFLVTGGLGEAAGKAVAKKLAKTTTEEIAGKTLGAQTKKLLVGNLEGATKALVMTPMMPSSYANFINNLTQLNAEGQMDLSAKAVGKAIEDGLIETFSENAGELFGIPFEGKIFEGISKSKLGEVGKAMSRTGAGQFLKQAGWHGLVGEMAEEVLGNAMRSALNVDENALKDFFSGDQFWTTLASFAPMSIVGAGSSAIQIRKAGRQMTKYGDQLKTMLANLGLDEDQMEEVEFMLDLSEVETPEELGSSIARVGRLVGETGLLTNDIAPDLGMAMGQYLQSAAEYKTLRGIFEEEQDIARAQNTALLDEQVGNKSWYHEGEDGANYVRTITDAEGNERFVVNSLDGQYALIGKDGSYSFLTNEELEAGIADGSLTDSGEQPINSYLDGIAENEQRTSEQERMAEETASQISAIQQRIAENPSFNIGTEEAPITASVTAANENGVHVVWTDSDGQNMAQDLTWEQVGNYLGTPVEVKTDEQIEDEEVQAEEDIRSRKEDYNKTIPEGTEFTAVLVEGEEPVTYQFKRAFINEDGTMMLQVTDKETGKDEQITEEMALQGNLTSVLDSFKTPAEVQQEEAVAEEETPIDDGVLRDFRGNPIPLKDDGSVNQTALWNADPEAWAKWNDSQRNDGGANSRGYIAKATKKLQSDAKAVQKQINKELDFDKIESLEGQLASINNRIADLERIENNYANAEVAQTEVEQTPEEVPAPVAPVAEVAEEAPVAETVPEVQEEAAPLTPEQALEGRLAEAKTPEEKRQALEEYYALTTTDPTVVGTRADILQRMAELGFSERVIGQVRDQLAAEGELTEGFHIGDVVFIVADDIRDARRARLAHLHEHWHEVNRKRGLPKAVASVPGATTEYLLATANKLAGIKNGKGYADYLNYPNPQQALADEVIALSMEVVAESTPENVDDNLRDAGLDNQEIINFVKTIYNGERGNDQTLDSSGRDTLSGDNAQEGERQDGGDIQPQPEGILGEQGSGSEERSIQGAGEGGLDTSGNPEVTPTLAPFVKEGDKLTSYMDAPTGQESPSAPDETLFSLRREEDSKDDEGKTVPGLRTLADGFLAKLADKPLTPEELTIGSDAIGEMVNYMMPYLDKVKDGKRYLPEEIFGKGWSTIFKNGSYGRTMENTLICMRTLAYNDFVNAVQEKVGRPLTPTESFLASQMLYDIATDPQCLYCYVALDRKAYNGFLKTYIEQRDAVLDKYKADDSIDKTYRLPAQAKSRKNRKALSADNQVNKLYLEYLDGRADTPSMRNRFNGWLDRIAEGTLIGMKDLTSPETRQRVAGKGASYAAQIDDAEKYAQSASWAKKQEEYRAYNGELLSMPQKVVDLLNSEYGLRFYSFSEYSPAFIVENMQMVRDAALRGLVGLAYTKEIDFAKIFAPTGININISCYGREAEDGTVVMDTKQGADWGEAQALRERYGNVGCVFVATNDRMVEWAIHQPWVDVVIPFHIVRTGEDIAKFYDWTNYTAMEADKDVKGRSRDIMPTEHMNDKDTFLRLCEERGLKPRFADLVLPSTGRSVTEDPDYMKLVNETRRSVNETVPIKPIFDLQEAKQSFDEFVEKGGYYAGWFTEEGAFERGVEQVAADVEAGKTAKDVDYGRQDIKASAEKLAAMAGKKKRPRSHQGTPRRIGGDKITKAQQNVLNYLETGEFKSEQEPLEVANATQKQPVSETAEPVVTEEDVMFRLSKNNKATVESWLKKREDINDEQRAEVVDYIDKLDDAKTQLATAKWFANGTIRIPEDMKKVEQAISVSGKAKVDPLRYNSPMELLDAHAEFKPSEERINPDEVSTLHRAAEYPDGIVVYDVDNTKQSRENMRKIINTHFGVDASPWCLLQGDGKGNLTESSAKFWKHYNAYPKQVAFKDGKLLAFSANDSHTRVWWDRQDQSHYGIPLTMKVEGDELGRTADYIVDEGGKLIIEPGGHMYRGNRQNGVYEEWNSDGSQLLSRIEYKDGKEDGISEEWYPSGQIRKRAVMKEDRYAGTYEQWYDNGQQKVKGELNEEGDWDGEQVGWYRNGNKSHEWRAKEGKTVGDHIQYYETGEPKFIQHYDEEGTLAGYEDYVSWRAEKGIKAHIGIGRRVTYAPGDSNRRTEEEFRANGKLHKREEYHGSKLDGIAEYYYPDGTLQSRTHFVEGERNGTKEVFHENGKLWLRGDFKDGEVDGLQEQWNKEGDLILREEWKDGKKVRTLPLDENVQFRKVEPIVDEKNEALFEQAKKTFGTTNNLAEAGYVIPDGSMLDFSGRHLLDPGQDSSWMNGMRQVDHREISDLNYEKDGNTPSGYETDMRDFIRRGAIRLNSGVINLATKPTKGQENVLWGLIQRANGDVDVDFGDGYDSDHYASYNHARPERILNDIRRYFDEGIEPDGNVMFRLSNSQQMDQDYMAAVEAGDMDTAQRMVDEMAEAAGYTIRGYHGTTHDFTIFDRSKGNAEGNWGKGFYFTNNEDDAEANYAGEGPDLTNRIELLAENMEWMDGYEDMSYEQRLEEARKQLAGDNPHVISAAIKMENPVVFDSRGGQQETFFDFISGYNEETDEYEDEPSGRLMDFYNAWNDVLADYEWEGNNVSPDAILEYGYDGLTASQLEEKAREILAYVETSDGQVATGEFLRQVFERMGFDGIVDNNVNMKFGSQRRIGRGMEGMDYGTTHVIAFNSNQIKQTDPVTYDDEGNVIPLSKRFDSWNEDIRFRKANQTQNGFISNAEAALDKIKMDKATPEQWIKMLEKEGGLKAGEDKWLGLSDWLKASDKKTLTKDEIADFIEQNRIQIEEQHYSESAIGRQKNDADEALERYQDEYEGYASDYRYGEVEYAYNWPSADEYAFDQMVEKYGDDFRLAFQIGTMGELEPIEGMDDDYSDAAKHFLGIEDTSDERPIDSVRLDYTTSGLTNKAEIALTVPTIDPWNEGDKIHFGDAGEGRAVAWIRFGDTNMTSEETKAVDSYLAEMREKYGAVPGEETDHMTEEEIAHLQSLTSSEMDATKPRVLVIDEIQSKRHQEGREKGYIDSRTDVEELEEKWRTANKAFDDYVDFLKEKYDDLGWPDEMTDEEEQRVTELDKASIAAAEAVDKAKIAVPAAPFEKNWHELAMKRMLRLAAEEGYDKIAWTTGDQQAERYNIGNVVNKIEAGIDVDGNRLAFISFREGGTLTVRYDDEGNITGLNGMHAEEMGQVKHLSDIVGKEIAKDALTINERGSANLKTYEGEGLRIGGEGMKGFYDDILPRFMNKYGKKWGVKVQDIELPGIGDTGLTMHSVDVTPEMKESVMEGQTMFRRSPITPEQDKEYMEAVNAGDMDKAQQMVNEAARRAGYNSPKLYHGTDAFGFTSINNKASDDGLSFWATDKEEVAGSYTKLAITRRPGTEIDAEEYERAYEIADTALDEEIRNFRYLIDRYFSEWYFGQSGNSSIREAIMDANHIPGYGDGVYDVLGDYVAEAYTQYGEDYREYEDFADWTENSPEAQEIFGSISSLEGLREQLWQLENGELSGGIYELYANTDNMFEVDAKGKLWNELHPEGLPKIERGQYKDVPYKTREVVKWAKENGYDGVIFKNIRDNGQYGRTEPSDVYAFLNPQAQVKSAEPVTYDDNGNVIPLSERFNEESDDIRFSLRGIIGAENAEDEVALDNLEVAREMENAGKDSPTIWRATGWERGADGKWRNEIPDAKQKEGVYLQQHNIAGEILDAPELFDSYPELTEIPIDLVSSAVAGAYNRAEKRITIDTDYNTTYVMSDEDREKVGDRTMDFIRNGSWKSVRDVTKYKQRLSEQYGRLVLSQEGIKTLLHELQHAIQAIEGFAKGTNEKLGERLYYRESLKTKPEETYFAWFLSRKNSTRTLNQVGREKVIRYSENYDKSNLTEQDRVYFAKLINYLKGISDSEFKKFVSRAAKVVKSAEKAGEESYEKSAGEVEARNVERRSRMSDEDRKKYSPEITEDYSRSEQGVRFRKVTDPATLERLESEPTIKVYRAMQEIDGHLYPPMAAKVEGKMQEPIELGVWEEAVERPDLADAKGNFTLNKGNGKSLKARYNPYIHTSRSPLNDQFTSAYDRPNLVTVEVEVPESELTSGYKAEKAKDSVGEMAWHSGPVSSKLPEEKSRKVILSRWDKPIRIVPDSEVADRIAELLEGEDIAVPYNTVTPSLREELEKRGVQISDTPSGTVSRKEEEVRFRIGYHAGDLGKAENNQRMQSGTRSTGHFGTGTYFVGNEEAISIGPYKDRPHHGVEFDDYNLYSPGSFNRGIEVHDLLERINYDIAQYPSDWPQSLEEYNKNATDLIHEEYSESPNLDRVREIAIPVLGEKFVNEALEEGEYGVATIRRRYTDGKDFRYKRVRDYVDEGTNTRSLEFWLSYYLHRPEYEVHSALIKAKESGFKDPEGDTPSTVFMKALGYEGVDVSGIDGLDNTIYGSVIYDIRPETVMFRKSREGGLTGVIGDENAAELYRNVYKAVPKEIRQQIVDKAGDSYLFSEATKNMISEAVEKGDKSGIAGLAANMLRDYAGPLDERTARYILWRGDRKVEDDDLLDTMNDIAMQRRLKVGQFAEQPMFRLADNIEDAENRAESMADDAKATLNEKKEFAKVNDALTTIKAMSLQKEYDRKTVNTITVLAKNVLKDQSIETLSRHEIARLLGIVTTSIGKAPKTVKKNADALIDMILGHMLKSEETKLGMLASVRATKTNTTGVEVQGELDVRGQNVLKAYKAGLDMDLENPTDEYDENTIKGRLAVLNDRLESTDDAVRSEAEDEIAGLMLAQEYQEKVKASINEERGIKNEMKDAAEQLRDGKISRTAYNEFVTEAENSIRENRIERIEAYQSLRAKMVSMMAGSIDARKEFTEREKQRVEEIHHLANSDMQGEDASPFKESTRMGRFVNSSIVRFLSKPLVTFDQMLRLFGQKNVAGEGYLWNKFHRGWIEANENAFLGEKEAKSELDEKVSEVFERDMRWSDLYAEERKMPKVKVKWWDGGEMKEHELTQGNLLYIYMVNKMTDGRMKLRRMGITQGIVDAIKKQMDIRFLELADWVQEKFLVEKRNKYNAVHERLFGASMAAIEDYFPLKINKRSLNKAEDIGRPDFDDALPATTTGSIIKRKRNAQDLDLLGADAFSVVIEHIEQMEQWAAFAEFNKDLNTLLSYKRFRNQVQNMVSVYGSGRELWNNFKAVSRIVGGTYSPAGKKSDLDTAALNVAKGVTSAKISFRVYTALKQLLSMPAFIADANIKHFGENLATPWKAWNWAMENLPMFEKRWKSRMAGDTRLMNTDSDWKFFRSQVYDTLSRLGMSPNAFVDAMTVSIGAHSIYQTRYDRYINDGYSEEEADKKAKQDATTLYNETQQSNEGAFVAPVQLDRTVLATMITVFRNSSMGYQRQLHDALRNIGKMMKPGYRAASIEFMKKQMERDGLTEEQAEHAANRNYEREKWRSAARVATFGFLVQFAWNLGGSIAYLLFGDDDDKKEEMLTEALIHGLIGGTMEGLAGGNVMSEALNMVAKGESLNNYDPSLLPIISDIKSAYKKMSYDPVAGSNDLFNLAIQAGIGVNPQTLTDAVVAVVDACGGDLETSTEAMLLIMRVLQVPQSQVDQIYIDELGMNADKARTMSPGEMAERYARYKVAKGAPLTGWAYSDEAEEKREKAYLKRFKKLVNERKSK